MNPKQNFFSNSNNQSKKNHGKYLDTITPVLISWLIAKTKNMKEEYIQLDTYSCDKFSIIGKIESVSEHNNKYTLKINDGTGQIDIVCIKKYEEKVPNCLKEINFNNKIYVRAVIDISTYNNEDKQVVIFTGLSFLQIKNYDIVTFHFLETLAFRNYRKNGVFNKNYIIKPSNNKKPIERVDKKSEELTDLGDKDKNDTIDNFEDSDIPEIIFKTIKSIKSKTHVPVNYKQICEVLKCIDKIKIDECLSTLNEDGQIYVVPGSDDCYDIF